METETTLGNYLEVIRARQSCRAKLLLSGCGNNYWRVRCAKKSRHPSYGLHLGVRSSSICAHYWLGDDSVFGRFVKVLAHVWLALLDT